MTLTRIIHTILAATLGVVATSVTACAFAGMAGWDPFLATVSANAVAGGLALVAYRNGWTLCIPLIAGGFTQPTSCTKPVPLLNDVIYAANVADIASFTSSTTLGEITDVVMVATKVFYAIQVEKDSANISDELQEDGSYIQRLTYKLASDTPPESNHVTAVKGARLVFIVRTRNDKFRLWGVNFVRNTGTPASSSSTPLGLELKTNTESYAEDAMGNDIMFEGIGLKEKAPYFFETSLAATIANIASYL